VDKGTWRNVGARFKIETNRDEKSSSEEVLPAAFIFERTGEMEAPMQNGGFPPIQPAPPAGPVTETPKKSRWKFWAIIIAFFLVVIIAALYFAWQWYLSPEAKMAIQSQKSYEAYMRMMDRYEAAMRADTYGSSTPEGTLQMFIAALKKGDAELASKYFLLDESGSRTKWEDGLIDAVSNNRAESIIKGVQEAMSDKVQDGNDIAFESLDSNGIVDILIEMKLNEYSGVWKIESM
jgi:hypothetical protein